MSTRSFVYHAVASLAQHKVDSITPEQSLLEHFGMDSLDKVELKMDLEDLFDVIIDDSVIHQWKTVGDVVLSMEQRVGT